MLAAEYHQRWEIESTIDELKTHLLGRKIPIRSLNPREVVQEIYGWLLGHWCIRSLMFKAAKKAGISPLRIGFTGTLNVIGQFLIFKISNNLNSLFFQWLIREILDEKIPKRQGRNNPRVVKKPRSKFLSKKPVHRGTGTQHQELHFSILSTA